MNKEKWSSVKAAEDVDNSVKYDVPAGAYVVEIVNVTDKVSSTGKKYLELILDVAEGPFKDFAKKAENATGNDWSYKTLRAFYTGSDKMKSQFRRLLQKFEESNRKFDIERWERNSDEKEFIGLLFGVVLDEKLNEYNGKVSKRIETNYYKIYSVEEIDKGEHQKPRYLTDEDKQKLEEYKAAASNDDSSVSNDEELPF